MQHLALIMDGNGRWAEERGLSRVKGHEEGAKATVKAINIANHLGIKFLSLYAFSSENFNRPKVEISNIFRIIGDYLEFAILPLIKKNDFQARFIGDLSKLPTTLLEVITKVNKTALNNKGMTIIFAIGYGGEEEVLNAFNKILDKRFLTFDNSPITYKEITENLYTDNLPNPDAVVRYGGFSRLSNFMPLQTVYSELIFLNKLWPDMLEDDIVYVYNKFVSTKRNFGKV